MLLDLSSAAWNEAAGDWLVVGVTEGSELTGRLGELNEALGGMLAKLIEQKDVTGKLAELVTVAAPNGIAAKRLLVVGLGKSAELDRARFEKAMMSAARTVSAKKDLTAVFAVPEGLEGAASNLSVAAAAEVIVTAALVGAIGQDLLKAEPGHFALKQASVLVAAGQSVEAQAGADRGCIIGESINLTRELINLPPQQIYPESFAERAHAVAAELGLKCDVLDRDQLVAERMGSLLAVAQGSDRPPRVVAIEYRGGASDAPMTALVGKGVTFDSGGLSIKPTDGMLTMKCDMAGAATVLGAIAAIARLKLPVNVTAYMGLVENMVSGTSYKLGDILKARNGTTIEVQNTDAEGRLVLADVLAYAVDRGAARLIDLATLTGACVVALGEDVSGAFTNNQQWCDSVLGAAKRAGELVWQLPMFDLYNELLKSDVADVRNIGGRWGGAITAAKFLEKFVSEKPWVHLDIAGPAFASSNKPHREGGATGHMLRTLVEVVGS